MKPKTVSNQYRRLENVGAQYDVEISYCFDISLPTILVLLWNWASMVVIMFEEVIVLIIEIFLALRMICWRIPPYLGCSDQMGSLNNSAWRQLCTFSWKILAFILFFISEILMVLDGGIDESFFSQW